MAIQAFFRLPDLTELLYESQYYIDGECRNKNCLKEIGGNDVQHKNWKGKNTKDTDYNNSPRRFRPCSSLLSPRDGHVIIVSGCLILTALNLIILIWISNIIDRLVSSCRRSIVTFDIGLHEVCVRVGVRYVITKFSRMDSLPDFVTHGAPRRTLRARESSAINLDQSFQKVNIPKV